MSIVELCTLLTTAQVLKIIKSYTLDDCENGIEQVFIEKLTVALNERSTKVRFHLMVIETKRYIAKTDSFFAFIQFKQTPNDVFTMEEGFVHPLKVVYKYEETKLEEIELPSILNLDSILTRM